MSGSKDSDLHLRIGENLNPCPLGGQIRHANCWDYDASQRLLCTIILSIDVRSLFISSADSDSIGLDQDYVGYVDLVQGYKEVDREQCEEVETRN